MRFFPNFYLYFFFILLLQNTNILHSRTKSDKLQYVSPARFRSFQNVISTKTRILIQIFCFILYKVKPVDHTTISLYYRDNNYRSGDSRPCYGTVEKSIETSANAQHDARRQNRKIVIVITMARIYVYIYIYAMNNGKTRAWFIKNMRKYTTNNGKTFFENILEYYYKL